jgi:hypothetical protein
LIITTSGLDLALSEKETGDEVALTTLDKIKYGKGLIEENDWVIRDIEAGHFSPNEVRDKMKITYYTAKPVAMRVESNGYQLAMKRDLADDGIPVTAYYTGGEKMDPTIGINSIAIAMQNGKFAIPFDVDDPHTIEESTRLINEMRNFPDGHTGDRLMSLFFAFSEARDRIGEAYKFPSTTAMASMKKIEEADAIVHDPVRLGEEIKRADSAAAVTRRDEIMQFNRMMRRR